MPRIGKSMGIEDRLVVARGWEGQRSWGVTATGYRVSFGVMKILKK